MRARSAAPEARSEDNRPVIRTDDSVVAFAAPAANPVWLFQQPPALAQVMQHCDVVEFCHRITSAAQGKMQ